MQDRPRAGYDKNDADLPQCTRLIYGLLLIEGLHGSSRKPTLDFLVSASLCRPSPHLSIAYNIVVFLLWSFYK